MILPLAPNLSQNPISTIWARNALADPVLLSALLFHSAAHLDVVRGGPLSAATLHHLGECIRQLNTQLQRPEEATSDSTIAAVGLVAATGVSTGTSMRGL